jgi:hypothetical protein
MEISFAPSPDITVVLNTLLDIFERRKNPSTRFIKVSFTDVRLPSYLSQTEPEPRFAANEQLQILERAGLVKLVWVPGETGHLIDSVILKTEHAARIYELLNRSAITDQRSRLETLLLADQFRFSRDDWRARAIHRTLTQLHSGKSPAPFSLTDSSWNLDLLTVLSALPGLETETPYRVFSVRTFNDSKRFDELKPAIVRLARFANPEWKTLTAEDILRELNLVANPNYIHLAGNWQLTTQSGEILSLGGFTPSVGFPAAQIETIQSVTIHADSVLCIENLTSFHEFIRAQEITQRNTQYATICLMGNPSPPIRRLIQLIPETTPIHLWSDMDYGGFNILSQLRRYFRHQIHPYLMDIPTFEKHVNLSRPLTQMDVRNLKHVRNRPELVDIRSIIEHLIHRGLKLEQEGIQI